MPQITEKIVHGAKSAIGATALQLTATSEKLVNGLLLVADPSNTGTIYAGKSGVTAGSADATDGIPLAAGDALTIEVLDPSIIYLIASTTGQKVYYLGT